MRKKNNIISYLIIAMLLSTLVSCDKMDDIHSEFLEEGEQVYLGKADLLHSRPGNERIQINWFINADPRVNNWTIFWNNRQSSKTIEKPTDSKAGDLISILLEDLPEETYTFEVISGDQDGNTSLPIELTSRVYGNFYVSNLNNRIIESASLSGDFPVDYSTLTINWETAPEGCMRTKLSYKSTTGEQQTRTILPEDNSVVIEDWDGELTYESSYLPIENALDTFATSVSTIKPQKLKGGTYLDFAGNEDIVLANGISMTSTAHDWNYPDTSDGSITHNGNCYDSKGVEASDFLISLSGLEENKNYRIFTVVMDKPHDFSWGTATDGSPVNVVSSPKSIDGAIDLGGSLYASPLSATFTADAMGELALWFGNGTSARTQFDGIAIIPITE